MSGIVVTGLWHAIGKSVSAYIAGLDCGDYTVASDGTITVPYQSDPDQKLTAAYIKSINDQAPNTAPTGGGWYTITELVGTITVTIGGLPVTCTVPMVIGFNYNSDGQLVRPDQQKDAGTTSPAMGEPKRIEQYAIQVYDTVSGPAGTGLKVGTDSNHLHPALFRTKGGTAVDNSTGYSGIHWDKLDDDYGFDNMFYWRMGRPFPATVVAITGFIEATERK